MRRADAVLMTVVGALGLFVGVQVLRAPRTTATRAQVIAGTVEEPNADSASIAPMAVQPSAGAPPTETLPVRDARRDVPGTYFAAMVMDLNGQLVRWPDRREQGLRIWVQTANEMRDWDLRYAQMARDAFDDWGEVGLPLRFDFILDSATADIRILWVERFSAQFGQRVGTTVRGSNSQGWLTSAQISIAIHDSTGRAIPPSSLAGIVRHEAGHALGLGHSNDPRTKMYPLEVTPEITARDRATLKLLYEFPPGPAR